MVDKVNVGAGSPESTEPEGHQEEMLKKVDAEQEQLEATTEEVPQAERPENVPEKFWDAEAGQVNIDALLKAQQDAESALRKQQNQKSDEEETPSEPEGDTPQQVDAISAARDEFAEKGELTDESYEALEKAGITRDMVDTYIAGQQAAVAEIETAAFQHFEGSREAYQEAVTWAAENLEAHEIEALDLQITSTNPQVVGRGAAELARLYRENADITPRTVITGQKSSTSGDHFKSSYEMTKAMADPRYAKDVSFRQEVARKVANAERAGINLFS